MEFLTVGERLTLYRNRAGLTKTALAQMTGTTVSAITKYEKDKAIPDNEAVSRLAVALKVTVNRILLGFDDPAKEQPMEGLIK